MLATPDGKKKERKQICALRFGILNELYVYVYFEIENEAPLVNKHASIWSLNYRRYDSGVLQIRVGDSKYDMFY